MGWSLLSNACKGTVSGFQARMSGLPNFSAAGLVTSSHGVKSRGSYLPWDNIRLCARAHTSSGFAMGELSLSCLDKPCGSLPRFHVDVLPNSPGAIAQVEGDEFWHMTKVLRLGVKNRIELFDGRGGIVTGKVIRVDRNVAHVSIEENARFLSPVGPRWHVAAAFGSLKGGRADWLVEKCTELGAMSVTPLVTNRSSSSGDRSERFERLIVAATKQCQRLHALELRKPIGLKSFIPQVMSAKVALVAVAEATPMAEILSSVHDKSDGGVLLIGPEGDFTEDEVKLLADAGALKVGLGPRRLRVETAAVAMLAMAILMDEKTVA